MDGGELLLGLAEVAGQGGGGAAGVGDEQPGAADRAGGVGAVVAAELPGGQGGGEPPADLGQQLRQAGRGERQLADELVGVGGLGEALAAEGGVVQGADRPGRGAGQGQGPRERQSRPFPSFSSGSSCSAGSCGPPMRNR